MMGKHRDDLRRNITEEAETLLAGGCISAWREEVSSGCARSRPPSKWPACAGSCCPAREAVSLRSSTAPPPRTTPRGKERLGVGEDERRKMVLVRGRQAADSRISAGSPGKAAAEMHSIRGKLGWDHATHRRC